MRFARYVFPVFWAHTSAVSNERGGDLFSDLREEAWRISPDGNDGSGVVDLETIRVGDFADTIREGGLEGSVDDTVKYNTPTALQDHIRDLNLRISAAIDRYGGNALHDSNDTHDAVPLVHRLKALTSLPNPDVLKLLPRQIPYVQYVESLFSRACPKWEDHLSDFGDPEEPEALPSCLTSASERLSEESKRDAGLRMRAALANETQMEALFPVSGGGGWCEIVADLLDLGEDFCLDLGETFRSVAAFVKVSEYVQREERKVYGDEAIMLQVGREDVKQPSLQAIRSHITILQDRHFFRQMWKNFSLLPLQAEANHLVDVWWNDPVHKWRYSVGLFQFFVTTGYVLTRVAAKVLPS